MCKGRYYFKSMLNSQQTVVLNIALLGKQNFCESAFDSEILKCETEQNRNRELFSFAWIPCPRCEKEQALEP